MTAMIITPGWQMVITPINSVFYKEWKYLNDLARMINPTEYQEVVARGITHESDKPRLSIALIHERLQECIKNLVKLETGTPISKAEMCPKLSQYASSRKFQFVENRNTYGDVFLVITNGTQIGLQGTVITPPYKGQLVINEILG